MSKHTPAPWCVNPGAGEVRGADWNVIVADVMDEQDARLIAAAPDLLAACERVVERWETHDGQMNRIDDVIAAIAKAKGEKP